jgi:23S rRNA pseudouridine2605 synthase
MFEYIGCPVTYLKRIRFGNLTLDGLETGEYRSLTEKEIDQLHLLVLQENE